MGQLEIVHEDPTLRIGVLRNLVVFAWYDAPEATSIRSLNRALQAVVAKHGKRFATLDVVVSGTARFSDAMREEMVKLLRDPRLQGQGAAHVIALPGLGGTAVRAFLSTMVLLGRPGATHKVFDSEDAGAAWLAPRLSTAEQPWSPEEVAAALTELKSSRPSRLPRPAR